jgi:CheY-like chemotaxis protein
MDDEPEILGFLQLALKRVGYDADIAREGQEALRLYQEAARSQQPFLAVIMDLTVPGGMGGKEAIRVFREFDPHVRAIVSSGYSNDPVMADFRRYGFAGVVPKPYQLSELARVLREVIAGGSDSQSAAEPSARAAG